jgi:hypothetical protein
MKANELRIGNFINRNDIKLPLTEFSFDLVKVLYNYSPIPLTEEWLLKFGFENMTSNERFPWWEHKDFIYLDFRILLYENNFYFDNGASEHCGQPLKYVHQLQNIYFALTGEELTIKP